jgi:hypothetical protein
MTSGKGRRVLAKKAIAFLAEDSQSSSCSVSTAGKAIFKFLLYALVEFHSGAAPPVKEERATVMEYTLARHLWPINH